MPERYLLYVAASRSYKNIDGLVRAFHLLKTRHRVPHALVIVGLAGRATPALEQLISSLGLVDDVVFSGFLDDRMLPLVYSAADAFVYPSFYEGFGLPVLEAMACGTPVAAANRTSLPEAVGDAGLLFDPANPEDMARTIARILDETELRGELVERGLVRARSFTWEKTAAATLATLSVLAS
ncbi:MAG: glycosyltransferase family 4 protein [Kofleriaceae bacterium]